MVAIVNNEKIYKYQIEFISATQKLSKKNAEAAGYDSSAITEQSHQEILSDLIRNIVVVQEAKKQGLTAKYSDAQKYISSNYDSDMSKGDNDDNVKFFKEYMSELKLSEKEYLKQASESYQDVMTKENFYNAFADKHKDS